MQITITILLMAGIGAAIGGFTNYLAIKMLFKPYNPVFIGKWQLPFTPGLIPKRRGELADQMGKLVVNHLLTPASIKQKFMNEKFRTELTLLVQKQLGSFLTSEQTPEQLFKKMGITNAVEKTETQLDLLVENKYEQFMGKYRDKPLRDALPAEIIEKANSKIPLITLMILQKGISYFSSMDGYMRIQRMVDDFVRERNGMFGNMLQMLAGNINLADKIQPEIIKFLKSEGTADLITTLIKNEWEKLLEREAAFFEDQFEKEKLVGMAKRYVKKAVNAEKLYNTPVSELTAKYHDTIVDDMAPKMVAFGVTELSEKIETLMERLRIADIVKEQVSGFSVARLEEMVFSIIKSELKMITYLGALLGGIIGIVQGIIALLMN
ncbi:DUF445 domain-containing protein [Cytobacillus gottheilii]|uniref:DUF445 domain-containing protein n=1 Tax=Cytobacillus gottheilii TaxID=859144 RepID=UPI0009BBDB6B|nr:DUF445 family protein [Cytobacillus gottheilii]